MVFSYARALSIYANCIWCVHDLHTYQSMQVIFLFNLHCVLGAHFFLSYWNAIKLFSGNLLANLLLRYVTFLRSFFAVANEYVASYDASAFRSRWINFFCHGNSKKKQAMGTCSLCYGFSIEINGHSKDFAWNMLFFEEFLYFLVTHTNSMS